MSNSLLFYFFNVWSLNLLKMTYHLLRFSLCHFFVGFIVSTIRDYLEHFFCHWFHNHFPDAYLLNFSHAVHHHFLCALHIKGHGTSTPLNPANVVGNQTCITVTVMKPVPSMQLLGSYQWKLAQIFQAFSPLK